MFENSAFRGIAVEYYGIMKNFVQKQQQVGLACL